MRHTEQGIKKTWYLHFEHVFMARSLVQEVGFQRFCRGHPWTLIKIKFKVKDNLCWWLSLWCELVSSTSTTTGDIGGLSCCFEKTNENVWFVWHKYCRSQWLLTVLFDYNMNYVYNVLCTYVYFTGGRIQEERELNTRNTKDKCHVTIWGGGKLTS